MSTTVQIDITFDQLLSLIKKLPKQQKIKLTKELQKDVVDSRLSRLLSAFETEELSLKTVDLEVENVRQELYDKQKR